MFNFGKPYRKNNVFTDLFPPILRNNYWYLIIIIYGICQSVKIIKEANGGFIEAGII